MDPPYAGAPGRWGWVLVLALPASLALLLRPLIPPVETRYINVAWEMWSQGHFLVPVLNTEAYSDKPPLFFWMIHAGWALFGVSEWWPRLIPALLAAANTALVGVLASRLWPRLPQLRQLATWMMAGTLAWMIFAVALMFDMLLASCVLLGLIGLLQAASGSWRGHALYALAIALGVLAKGPVILLHLLPPALLAPLWQASGSDLRRWYRRTAAAVAGGILLAGLWVVPAALFGGDAYREKILWTQTAGRVTDSFAHRRPWWFYFLALPLLALPWCIWPRVWSGARRLLEQGDRGLRFLLCGLVPVFIGFSAISGKQIHYLLPWLPGVVLLAAAGLAAASRDGEAVPLAVPALVWIALPIVAAAAVILRAGGVAALSLPWALVCGLAAVAVAVALALRRLPPLAGVRWIAAGGSLVLTLLLVIFVTAPLATRYDVGPAARVIGRYASAGAPLASTSAYNGEFGFFARLTVPVRNVGAGGVAGWCARHPEGLVIDRRQPGSPPRPGAAPLYHAPFRGLSLRLWSCGPGLAWEGERRHAT